MRANSDHNPPVFEYLGKVDGYYFNYNITTRETEHGTTWDYDYVKVKTKTKLEVIEALQQTGLTEEEANQIWDVS